MSLVRRGQLGNPNADSWGHTGKSQGILWGMKGETGDTQLQLEKIPSVSYTENGLRNSLEFKPGKVLGVLLQIFFISASTAPTSNPGIRQGILWGMRDWGRPI